MAVSCVVFSIRATIGMLSSKLGQLARDPVLRKWLVRRALGREPSVPPFDPGRPPYLSALEIAPDMPSGESLSFANSPVEPPRFPLTVGLPGASLDIEPGGENNFFAREWDDLETSLAVHRFAWLPLAGGEIDPGWVGAMWHAWSSRHGGERDGWAWHPYTAAERAINILDFARRVGIPGRREDTLRLLAAHGSAILRRLEYNGEHYTSNHLSNNGRGLYLLGLALGIDGLAEIGGKILVEEAARIFSPFGMLREGSTHYHLLLTRNYASAWLAAEVHGRPEAGSLGAVTEAALKAASGLELSGGLPLIGDISPDCPPDFLHCLLPGHDLASGWGALLGERERDLLASVKPVSWHSSTDGLAMDGWLRFENDGWSGLWHAAPDGWSHMPGHGHQDVGSFELHHDGQALIIDLGRGRYGDHGDAGAYVSAERHNGITLDGLDPYPANRPYFSAAFRHRAGGRSPTLARHQAGVGLDFDGFGRISKLGRVERNWAFSPGRMVLSDRVAGRGRHRLCRRIHTGHRVHSIEGGVIIEGPKHSYRIGGTGEFKLAPATSWQAYGVGWPATAIELRCIADLPIETEMFVEVV